MSAYLARLKSIDADNLASTPYIEVPKLTKAPFGTYGTSPMGHIVKNNSDIEAVSNWWLVSYAEIENVQVAVWPHSTHAEILALNPTALSARPITLPIDETVEVITND